MGSIRAASLFWETVDSRAHLVGDHRLVRVGFDGCLRLGALPISQPPFAISPCRERRHTQGMRAGVVNAAHELRDVGTQKERPLPLGCLDAPWPRGNGGAMPLSCLAACSE